jgi:hypothetical protein
MGTAKRFKGYLIFGDNRILMHRKDALSSRASVACAKVSTPRRKECRGMFKVIIWATDGSSGAQQALQFAKGLAQADGGPARRRPRKRAGDH